MAILLCIVVLIIGGVALIFWLKNKQNAEVVQEIEKDDKTYTLEKMRDYVKKRLDEITKINLYDIGLSEEELKRRKNKKYALKKALKGCTYGDVNDKRYVKELISDLLSKEYGVDETNISKAIPFDVPSLLTAQDKFDIIIYMYKKEFGYEALTELIKRYNLATLKYLQGESKPSYVITEDEISDIYEKEKLVLSFKDKLEIVVQRIYQHYKGYSSIDEIRDMNIDGVSGGVSGLPESFISQVAQTGTTDYIEQVSEHKVPRACDSIWIFFQGKSIRLAFLSFGTEAELKRVCQNIYKYNNPGQLSDTNGYKVNEMKDGSRVVVVRPSMSETWAFFVRKFDVKRATVEQWTGDMAGKEKAIELLKYLVKGARITSITGEQGCGKTTLLMGLIENIYETMNLRITEMAFELHLRKVYPTRNILSMRETDTISGQECLDVKKTDGSVNIIGEVATDPVASWMIQSAQVASKFTLFTHHAKTFPDLVTALRNSMLRAGVFKNEKTAEEQVVQVLNFDIHLQKDFRGRRYIERVTECIPVKDSKTYDFEYKKEHDMDSKVTKFFENATTYFSKVTEQNLYTYQNVLEYVDGEYQLTNKITDQNIHDMRANMDETDAVEFDKFIEKYWGKTKKV